MAELNRPETLLLTTNTHPLLGDELRALADTKARGKVALHFVSEHG
jgi:hypothetical protein